MATEVTYSEIQCLFNTNSTLKTQRIANFILGYSSQRLSLLNYRNIVFNTKISYFQSNPLVNEKNAISGKGVAQIIINKQGNKFIPYFISPDNELFVKLTLNPSESITFYVDTSEPQPQDENVPTLFDHFTSGSIDNSKWSATADNISFTDTTVICSYGDTNLTTVNLGTLDEYVIKYRAIQHSDSSRWSCSYYDEVVNNDNSHTSFYEGSDETWTNFFSTGSSSSLANLPVYNWHTVEIHYSKSQGIGKFYFNGELKLERQVPDTNGVSTYFKFYSCRKMEYDYILIYKKNPSSLTIDVSQVDSTTYKVKVTNNSSSIVSQEIKIEGLTPSSSSLAVYIPSITYTYLDYFIHNDTRFAFTEKGLPGQDIRYATYVPNVGLTVSSTQIILPFRYFDERVTYIGNQLITQRYTNYTTSSIDERYGEVRKFNKLHVSTHLTIQPIQTFTNRICYFESNYNFTNRLCQLVLRTQTEILGYLHSYNKSLLTSPIVHLSLTDFYSEVKGYTHTYNPLSERLILIQRNPDTLRYATFNYSIVNDRYSTYQTSQIRLLHDTIIIQCHPYYSEKFGFTKGIQWFNERISYYKVGNVKYILKPAFSTSPKLTIVSKEQLETTFKLYTETNSEVFIDGGNALSKEQYNIYLQSISGLTTNNSVSATIVETIKGTAITDSIEKKSKILTIGKFIASLCTRHKTDIQIFTKSTYRWNEKLGFTNSYEISMDERNSIYEV